jgi:hypothetical protein
MSEQSETPNPTSTTQTAPTADPNGWAPGAYARFQETARENERLKAEVAKAAADIKAYESKYSEAVSKHGQQLVLARAGGQFGHPSVQRAVLNEYAEHAREAGDKAKPFDAWFADTETRANPLIGRFFDVPSAGTQAAAPPPVAETQARQPAPPPASPNVGARETQTVAPATIQPGEWSRTMAALPRGPGAKVPPDLMARVKEAAKIK